MYHIHERSFLKIILCCSFFISVNALADGPVGRFERVEVYDDGRYLGIRGVNQKTNTQHGRLWQGVFDRHTSQYASFDAQDLSVRHAKTGLSSSSKVAATIEATVSRQSVLSGAFGLVKRGAALGTRLSGWGTAAYFAYEAYQAVKGDLESQGYHYDEAKEEFYKDWAARSCIWERDRNNEYKVVYVDCFGVDSSVIRNKYSDDPKKQQEIKFLMEAQMERLARPYWKGKQKRLAESDNLLDWNKYIFDKCYFNWNGGDCLVKRGDDARSVIGFSLKMNEREILTPQKFLEIATPKIDSNPTPFVEGTGRPGYSEGVQVSPTVVTLGPVTGSDGRPIQITFGKDSNGKPTATVTTTPRPDLTPGSPAAPKTNPTPTPGENGKPGSQPDPNPDGKPGSQPDPTPDGSPSDKKPSQTPTAALATRTNQSLTISLTPMVRTIQKRTKDRKRMTSPKKTEVCSVKCFRTFWHATNCLKKKNQT